MNIRFYLLYDSKNYFEMAFFGVKKLGFLPYEPRHEISNNMVCVTSKDSDQPVHTPRLIRAFASSLNAL